MLLIACRMLLHCLHMQQSRQPAAASLPPPQMDTDLKAHSAGTEPADVWVRRTEGMGARCN